MIATFTQESFQQLCNQLANRDIQLKEIIEKHGYPPMWQRKPNFETLIHIILEQQVSLASAKAALQKLKQKIRAITPKKLLVLSDSELKDCYFSRQKIVYARHLAQSMLNGELNIQKIITLSDDEIRNQLTKIKGIGNWTVDIFLLMGLQRTDIFPVGDLAMINSLKKIKKLPKNISKEEILILAKQWTPHRSIATMLLWHSYIKERNLKI
jgi:DNA-3-methyladenine glycosylase II